MDLSKAFEYYLHDLLVKLTDFVICKKADNRINAISRIQRHLGENERETLV